MPEGGRGAGSEGCREEERRQEAQPGEEAGRGTWCKWEEGTAGQLWPHLESSPGLLANSCQ